MTNGAINDYTFTLTTTIPIANGDVLKFEFPKDIQVNAGGATECTPTNTDDKIVCGISGNDIQITISSFAPRTENKFEWTMT